MLKKNPIVTVANGSSILEALGTIDKSGQGIALRLDENGRLLSTLTDGDLRRLLINGFTLESEISSVPLHECISAPEDASPRKILEMMNENVISHIPVVDTEGKPTNLVKRADIQNPILLSTPHLGEEEQEFVNEAFRTNWVAPAGPHIDAFETGLAEFTGAKYACAVSSGTAGIHLCLRLLGVGAGDTVFVSDFTFIASAAPVLYQGATPVFIDSEPGNWNMSPMALKHAFDDAAQNGNMPKAVIVVNLYGQSADMDPIIELCNHHGVPIVEDAAESLGAMYKGKASGTFGKLGVYSFNGNKIITTSGGGMIVSDDKSLIDHAKKLSTQAREPVAHYEHIEIGYNYRMSNVLAGIGRGQLQVLSKRVAQRRQLNEAYRKALAEFDIVSFMPEPEWSFSNRWLSCIKFSDDTEAGMPTALAKHLHENLIEARPLWKPMHMQPVFESAKMFRHDAANKSVSRNLFETGLCLPSGSNMSENEIEAVAQSMRDFLTAHA
ncbi:aminotransferase class I/II-fold pyridoxal phosphate-dependent enzyme [Cognatishimia sp. 1_MG-2023]|uniref:aminotransferase class I/II-fold pyridoxal phosphate-dependent enzyme n=1 Tax=Cognatishimia sp. 1_MG-2023 TaxID=3062642 RepID=UPI0026E2416A|nr:aminotransferase class I/II-fold pyridoxal phosphate-dependent enzyme [Cognatishimia sp. 1_MG-2023]MDO6728359.1 aminotransferase class I/II-fold pyridoxal phosphate-dependent enzyme [Cognatishimia sp. 1_MG-2023]